MDANPVQEEHDTVSEFQMSAEQELKLALSGCFSLKNKTQRCHRQEELVREITTLTNRLSNIAPTPDNIKLRTQAEEQIESLEKTLNTLVVNGRRMKSSRERAQKLRKLTLTSDCTVGPMRREEAYPEFLDITLRIRNADGSVVACEKR